MTREEFQDFQATLDKLVDLAVGNNKPSLPFNLDEAAEKYAWRKEEPLLDGERLSFCFNPRIDAFKAGAEWMAKQLPLPEDSVAFQKGVQEGKRLAIETIRARIDEILGDAQPNPILRMELQELIKKIES